MKDDSGQTNVILWPALLEKYRCEALGASLLVVYGVWQIEGKVRHIAAQHLVNRTDPFGGLRVESYDFH